MINTIFNNEHAGWDKQETCTPHDITMAFYAKKTKNSNPIDYLF